MHLSTSTLHSGFLVDSTDFSRPADVLKCQCRVYDRLETRVDGASSGPGSSCRQAGPEYVMRLHSSYAFCYARQFLAMAALLLPVAHPSAWHEMLKQICPDGNRYISAPYVSQVAAEKVLVSPVFPLSVICSPRSIASWPFASLSVTGIHGFQTISGAQNVFVSSRCCTGCEGSAALAFMG